MIAYRKFDRRTGKFIGMLCGGAAMFVPLSAAVAQDAAGSGGAAQAALPTDIVVTASRRGEQTLLKVPQAVDAYSGATLQQFKVSSVQDLTKLNPSLTVVSSGATQQQIVIRGISSSVGQTTGVYLDESPLVGPFNANVPGDGTPSLRLHDIDHIEVLKGPQGTLFGAGSMDGTLRTVTNKPNLNTMSGMIDMSASSIWGGHGFFDGNAALNVPVVSDTLGVRVAGWSEQGGGYIDKVLPNGTTQSNSNDEHLIGGRVSLRWKPVQNLTIDASANYQHAKVDGPQYVTASVGFLDTPANLGRYENFDPIQEYYHETYQLYSLTADYDLGFGNIVASGSYGRKSLLDIEDTSGQACLNGLCQGGAAWPDAFSTHMRFRDYTGELRFSSRFSGPFQIVAGAYYENDLRDYSGATILGDASTGKIDCETFVQCVAEGLQQPGFANSPIVFANSDRFTTSQYALYAQADYKILHNLTFTVGGRYFHAHLTDQQTDQQEVYPDYIFGEITTPTTGAKTSANQHKPTYNFALLWEARPNISVYARAASGFRIGGINNSASIAAQSGTPIPSSFAPDSLWDYEGGVKFFLMDRKLSVDLSGYHIDWKGQQINALAAGTFNYTINAGLTKTNGGEASITYRPTPDLTLGASATYVDARLAADLPEAVVESGSPGLKGDRVPYVPHWGFTGRAEYSHDIGNGTKGYLQTDFNYRGSSYTAFRPVSAEEKAAGISDNYYTKLPSYFLLNLRAGVRLDQFDISVFARNVTNKYAVIGLRADANSLRYYTAQPRSVGVSASAHF